MKRKRKVLLVVFASLMKLILLNLFTVFPQTVTENHSPNLDRYTSAYFSSGDL
jgi:hypothetical protein